MKKTISTLLLSIAILGTTSIGSQTVSAAEVDPQLESTEITITPYINWSGSAYLTTSTYSNVTSSNNVFADSPLVTNSANNSGSITVRVIGSNGSQVGGAKTIAAGKSARLDQIPAMSGTYTIQAKASKTSGNYTISVN